MRLRIVAGLVMLVLVMPAAAPSAQEPAPAGIPESLRSSVDAAVALVKPALVRIEVVTPDYYEGREVKYESSGSGVIITPEGHVVTNHHVAGRATGWYAPCRPKRRSRPDWSAAIPCPTSRC